MNIQQSEKLRLCNATNKLPRKRFRPSCRISAKVAELYYVGYHIFKWSIQSQDTVGYYETTTQFLPASLAAKRQLSAAAIKSSKFPS